MDVTVCIPTLNRYDKLELLLNSLINGTHFPNIYIIDNGGEIQKNIDPYIFKWPILSIHQPGYNLGVAGSWNWFIRNVPEIRIISNDDILFEEDSIQKFVQNYKEDTLLFPNIGCLNQFSCFMIPDKIVELVGYFDERISPNYAYFEDNDYSYRMLLAGAKRDQIKDLNVYHSPSSTKKMFNKQQRKLHGKKFRLAKENYIKKWGGEPGKERFTIPYGK